MQTVWLLVEADKLQSERVDLSEETGQCHLTSTRRDIDGRAVFSTRPVSIDAPMVQNLDVLLGSTRQTTC
jgi:hypothetical protein